MQNIFYKRMIRQSFWTATIVIFLFITSCNLTRYYYRKRHNRLWCNLHHSWSVSLKNVKPSCRSLWRIT